MFMISNRDDNITRIRSAEDELIYTMRAKILNPRWIRGLMRHGYSGAAMVPASTSRLLMWGENTEFTHPWMFRGIVQSYVMDGYVRDWMMDVNPHAMGESLEDVIGAADMGLWEPSYDESVVIRDAYLEVEGMLEECAGGGMD